MELSSLFPGPLQVDRYIQIQDRLDDDHDQVSNRRKDPDNLNLNLKYGIDQHKYAYLLDIWSSANMGLFASYFGIGFVGSFTRAPLQYYLIEVLDASSQQYAIYTVMHRIPWSIKFIFGLMSDTMPIVGYRRKPWLVIGWSSFTAFNIALMMMRTPGIEATIYFTFSFTCGLAMADVCTDTLCVERANYETDSTRGRLQSFGYIVSSTGKVIGAIAGTFLYDTSKSYSLTISQIFLINAVVPVLGLSVVIWHLIEICNADDGYHLAAQISAAWRVLQLRAVWRPMIFLYTYSMLQV
jgi:MFS family permease